MLITKEVELSCNTRVELECNGCNIVLENNGIFYCKSCETKIFFEKIIQKILNEYKLLGRLPYDLELSRKMHISSRSLTKYIKDTYNFKNWRDYFRQKGCRCDLDLNVNGTYKCAENITFEEMIILFKQFEEKYNKLPIAHDCLIENNLPSRGTVTKLLNKRNINLNDFYNSLGKLSHVRADADNYNFYLERYKEKSKEFGYPLKITDLINNPYGLPSGAYFLKYCPNKSIKNFNQFIEWCGFLPRFEISEELATKLILEKQKQLGRILISNDFKNISENEIGITTIKRIWGSFKDMQIKLGLPFKRDKTYIKDINQLKEEINMICDDIYNKEKRNVITYADIKKYDFASYPSTYCKAFKKINNSLRSYLESIGFALQIEGNGLNYIYEDGEKVRSQFELEFSNYLRNKLDLKYNIDYNRDVQYKNFTNCKKNYNCDYIIKYKDNIIYIEIAGMLKPIWKNKFRTESCNSKSKEKYRQHLIEKENFFIENNLQYYILFEDDIYEEVLNKIFNWEGVSNEGK